MVIVGGWGRNPSGSRETKLAVFEGFPGFVMKTWRLFNKAELGQLLDKNIPINFDITATLCNRAGETIKLYKTQREHGILATSHKNL